MGLKEKFGIVVSTKIQKTIVVLVEKKFRHPRYTKNMVKTKWDQERVLLHHLEIE